MRSLLILLSLILSATPVVACVSPGDLSGGGTLCEGVYEIEELLLDASLDGNGSVLRCPTRLKTGIIIEADDVAINNITVTGCGNAVYIDGHDDVRLDGVVISNSTNGIVLIESSDIMITGSTITTNTRSIFSQSSDFDSLDSSIDPVPYIQESPDDGTQEENGTQGDDGLINQTGDGAGEENVEDDSPKVFEVNITIDEDAMRDIFNEVLLHVNLSDDEREMLTDELVADYTAHYRDAIQIRRTFRVYDDHTEVDLDISATRSLQDVRIYEEIPKCAAQYTEEVTFSSDVPRVIKDDPLIMWEYEDLESESIRYLVQDSLPPACQDMFRTAIIPKSRSLYERIEEIRVEEKSRTHVLALFVLLVFVFLLVIYAIWQRR